MPIESKLFTASHYSRLTRENEYIPYPAIDFNLGRLTEEELQASWLCHHGADQFSEALKRDEPGIVCTGIGLSGPPHVGTITQIVRAVRIQQAGIPVQLVLGDLDAYNGKRIPWEITKTLTHQYIDFAIALGFRNETPSILRNQADHPEVLLTAYEIANFMNEPMFEKASEELHEYYASHGKVDRLKRMSYPRRVSLNLMTADFFHYFMEKEMFNVLVSLGIDEHVYVRFARQTLEKVINAGILNTDCLLAGMYTAIIKGLYKAPKISKSFPESGINVELSGKEVLQRLLDGDQYEQPINSPVFQMMMHLGYLTGDEIDKAYRACRENSAMWKKIKTKFAGFLNEEIISKWPR